MHKLWLDQSLPKYTFYYQSKEPGFLSKEVVVEVYQVMMSQGLFYIARHSRTCKMQVSPTSQSAASCNNGQRRDPPGSQETGPLSLGGKSIIVVPRLIGRRVLLAAYATGGSAACGSREKRSAGYPIAGHVDDGSNHLAKPRSSYSSQSV